MIDEDNEEILYELKNADVNTQNLYAWLQSLLKMPEDETE